MALKINFDEDFDVLDDVEAIFFTPVGALTSVKLPKAFIRAVTVREAATSGGAYSERDTVFTIPRCAVDRPPEAGSLILTCNRDELYYVYAVDRIINRTQYRMISRRGYLQRELTDIVTVSQNAGGKDSYGVPYKRWIPFLLNQPAKIQELENSVESDQDRVIVGRTVQIYTESTQEIVSGMRVETKDRKVWNINSVTGKGELGLLVVLDCTEARSPGA